MKSFDSFDAQKREKIFFSRLEQLWESLPVNQRTEIEKLVDGFQENGAIVSVYNFLETVPAS